MAFRAPRRYASYAPLQHYARVPKPRSTTPTRTFFSSLADDELVRILRHAQVPPHESAADRNQWSAVGFRGWTPNSASLNVTLIGLAFDAHGPFVSVVPTLFRVLRVRASTLVAGYVRDRVLDIPWIHYRDLVSDVLAVCGSNIQRIEVLSYPRFDHEVATSLIHVINRACPGARQLQVRGVVSSSIFLQDLYNTLLPHVRNIDMRALEPLVMFFLGNNGLPSRPQQHLRSITYNGDAINLLLDLWQVIGQSLDHVKLTCYRPDSWNGMLNYLRSRCPNLTSIELNNPLTNPNICEETYALFLGSYKNQLRRATLHSMESYTCGEVLNSCPNVRCMYFARNGRFESIGRIGSSLQDLVVRVRPTEQWSVLRDGIRLCGHIETLKLYQKPRKNGRVAQPISNLCYDALFSRHLRALERLTLSSVPWTHDMYMVAANTSALKTLVLNFFAIYDIVLLPVFRNLVERNPKLEAVQIGDGGRHDCRYSTTKRILKGIIKAFVEAAALRVLVVEMNNARRLDWEELSELAQPLRRRCISFRLLFSDASYGCPSVHVD